MSDLPFIFVRDAFKTAFLPVKLIFLLSTIPVMEEDVVILNAVFLWRMFPG